jgi:hypothetical protein
VVDGDDVLTFADALADQRTHGHKPAVLLGNGFSIDWKPNIFRYSSLFEEADLRNLSAGKEQLFDALSTHDFEIVIEYLNAAVLLAKLYRPKDKALAKELADDAKAVKHGLAEVLAKRHPRRPAEVTDDEATHARAFLSHFRRVFSVNYDLLLYWVINREELGYRVPRRDGFQWPTFEQRDKLVWKSSVARHSQEVSYLHGGFHLFVEDRRVRKLDYDTAPLIRQITARLDAGEYPLVVTEGRTSEKLRRINSSTYLRFCLDELRALEGDLFVHGLSLASNDNHIFSAISDTDSNINNIYVGVHGRATSDGAQETMRRARLIARKRRENKGAPLGVKFYKTSSAHVWRGAIVTQP